MSEAADLLARLLALAAPGQPDSARRAFVWLDGKGREERVLTFADVGAQASCIAKTLLLDKCGLGAGDKVLLVFLPGLDFIVSFVACLLAGCVAVPIYPPDPRNPAKGMAKLLAAVEVTEPKVALSHNEFLRGKRLQVLSGKGPKYPKGLAFHSVTPVLKKAVFLPELFQASATRDPHRLAFIQFSSGSTGSPKAVAISWGNLNANLHSIERCFGGSKTSMAVSWVPFYHDMGLVGGACHSIYTGAEHVIMSPVTFLRRPFTWLEAISRYRGTITSGVNFAYDILVSKVTDAQLASLDLSSCTRYSNGAEPVRASTLRAFLGKFRRCGVKMAHMDPIYGGAENVVFASNRPGPIPREPLFVQVNGASLGMGATVQMIQDELRVDGAGNVIGVELVGNGEPGATTEIVAVHPDKPEALGPDVVGELWIAGPSKALGYIREKGGDIDATQFSATLHGQEESGGTQYYRTGDLGFLHEGQVFVCGRLKDMLIINGQNVFPQDLEHAVCQASPLVRPGCVIVVGVESSTTGEAAVAIAEVRDASKAAQTAWYEAAQAIKRHVLVETGVQLEQVHFIRPRTIPKTTSGKVQRAEAKRRLLDGTLGSLFALGAIVGASSTAAVAHAPKTAPPPLEERAACVEWTCARVADILGVDSCAPDDDVHAMGITSVGSVALAEALEELLGHTRKIDDFAAFFADNATPAQMVTALVDLPASRAVAVTRVEQSLPPLRHVKSRRLAPCVLLLLQFMGISLVCALVFVAVLPSYHFVYWVLFTLDEPWLSTIRLWDDVFQYGVLVALAQPLFLLSFSVAIVSLKWVVIGRYKSGTALDMNSFAFFRWWLVDRGLYAWHTVVGQFIVSTPLANIFLIFMGADVAMSAKIGVMPSGEFDLFHVGKDVQLDGSLLARAFDAEARTLRLRSVRVGQGAVVHVRALVLPGAHIQDGTVVEPLAVVPEGGQTLAASVYAGNSATLQVSEAPAAPPVPNSHWCFQLVQKLAVMIFTLYTYGLCSTVGIALWGVWGYPANAATPLVFWSSQFFLSGLCFTVLSIVFKRLLFRFASRGPLARFTVDFQYKVAFFAFLRIFATSRCSTLLLRAFGASAASTSFCASTNTFKASNMDSLVLEEYAFVTVGTFRGPGQGEGDETGGRTKTWVRAGVEISSGAVVDSGADVYRRVAPNTHFKRTRTSAVDSAHVEKRTTTDVEPTSFAWPVWEEACVMLLRVGLYAWFVLALVPAYAYAVWVLYGDALFWLPTSQRSPAVESRSLAIVLLFPTLPLAMLGLSVGFAFVSRALLPGDPKRKLRPSLQCVAQNTASVIEVLLIPLTHGTSFYNAHASLLGATVGRSAFLYSIGLRDLCWLELGGDCVVDGAWVMGHQFSHGKLHNARARIGAAATVNPGCIVFAGLAANDAEVIAHGKLAFHARAVPNKHGKGKRVVGEDVSGTSLCGVSTQDSEIVAGEVVPGQDSSLVTHGRSSTGPFTTAECNIVVRE